MRGRLLSCIVFVLAAALSASCHRRPLEEPDDELSVKIYICTDNVANVTSGIYNPDLKRPSLMTSMMRVLFYDREYGNLVSQCFISQCGVSEDGRGYVSGRTALPPGDYTMLAYNFDVENIVVSGIDRLETITACASAVPEYYQDMLKSGGDETPVYRTPEHLLVARRDVHLGLRSGAEEIVAEASTVVDTYYLQVRVRGLKYASEAKATLSGMSRSNRIGLDERYLDGDSRILFDIAGGKDRNIPDENKDVLCALFNTFGKIDGIGSDLTVRFDVITSDGTRFVKTLDIQPTFGTEDAVMRKWLLIDYVLDIPEPRQPGDGGFIPGTVDWDEIHDTIEIQ